MSIPNFDLSNLSLAEIAKLRENEAAELNVVKALLANIDDEIAKRLKPTADAAYAAAQKDTGKVTLDVESPGYVASAERDKKVVWEQERMRAIAGGIPWAEANHWFTFKIEMTEAKFKSLPPGDLRTLVEEARTVIPGDTKVSLKKIA
jgi:hypothetical protein